MKTFIKLVVTVLVLFAASIVNAQTTPWQSRVDGKVVYYFTTSGDHSLVISCPQRGSGIETYSEIRIQNNKKKVVITNFNITVGKTFAEAPVGSESKVDEDIFLSLVKGLRTNNISVMIDGYMFGFTSANAANVIPPVNSPKFNCRTMWRE